MTTIEEVETTTVFVGDDRYEVAPSWTVGEFKRRVGEPDGDVHVRGRITKSSSRTNPCSPSTPRTART